VQFVIDVILGTLKLLGAPGSIAFLVLCSAAGIGIGYVWPRRKRIGRAWLFIVFCAYIVLGTPVVAYEIADGLSGYEPVRDLRSRPQADLIVLLAGDNLVGRIHETIRAYREWSPSAVVVSAGDEWTVEQLVNAGIPSANIFLDLGPANTLEQIDAFTGYVARYGATAPALIASTLQMPRVAALSRMKNLRVTLLPSAVDTEPPRTGVGRWVPRYTALRISRDAIYERAALAYYVYMGRLRRDAIGGRS
jgi:uncharacterized SAM-binding protein YcdF (DUF218 family)